MRFQATFIAGFCGPGTSHADNLARAQQMAAPPYGAKVEEILLRPHSNQHDRGSPFAERASVQPAVALDISLAGLAAYLADYDF